MTTVLIVDDEPPIQRALHANLVARGYDVLLSGSGEQALELATVHHPDVVILDLGLPGMDGLDVVRRLREWTSVPVIILSARGTEGDKVAALDAGADDFVAKPFGHGRVPRSCRAGGGAPRRADGRLCRRRDGPLPHRPRRRRVTDRAGAMVRLTPTEWAVLEVLVRNAGRLVTQRQLLEHVWGPSHGTARQRHGAVHMAHLRRKLEPDPTQPHYLLTEPGIG